MIVGLPGVGGVTRRGTDPLAAWWHPPALLPVAGALAAVDLAASVVARGVDRTRVADDLARAGRVLTEVVAPSRHEPFGGDETGIVRRWDLAVLRRVDGPEVDDDEVPELVVPPQGTRLDHLLGTVRGADGTARPVLADVDGPRPAHVLQWATDPSGDAGIEGVLAVVADAVSHLGGRVRLTGWSQGGWLSLIHAALDPDSVAELTLVGAPITFHPRRTFAGVSARAVGVMAANPVAGPVLAAWAPTLVEVQHAVLARDLWRHLDPVGETARAVRVLGRVAHDEAYDAGMRALTAFTATAPMSRRQYAWFIEHLVVRDELARGVLELGGRTVSPADVTCPVRIVAGARDRVVPRSQALETAGLVGTNPSRVTTEIVPRDHLGLFTRG